MGWELIGPELFQGVSLITTVTIALLLHVPITVRLFTIPGKQFGANGNIWIHYGVFGWLWLLIDGAIYAWLCVPHMRRLIRQREPVREALRLQPSFGPDSAWRRATSRSPDKLDGRKKEKCHERG